MNFKLRSTQLLESLQDVKDRFSGRTIKAELSVSDEASWWYFHEFGTATHAGEGSFETPPSTVVDGPDGSFNSSGYDILPKNGDGIRLPITSGFPNALILPQVGGEYTLHHPGVPALGLVRTVLEDIHTLAAATIANSLHEGEYEPQTVQTDLMEQVMPEVLNLIVASIDDKMGKSSDRDTPGKLGGASPADVFRGAASISEPED